MKQSSRHRVRRFTGYADNLAIIVVAAILVMIAIIYGLSQLGHAGGAPIASPSFPPQSESPSPSPADTPAPHPTP